MASQIISTRFLSVCSCVQPATCSLHPRRPSFVQDACFGYRCGWQMIFRDQPDPLWQSGPSEHVATPGCCLGFGRPFSPNTEKNTSMPQPCAKLAQMFSQLFSRQSDFSQIFPNHRLPPVKILSIFRENGLKIADVQEVPEMLNFNFQTMHGMKNIHK